MKLFSVDQLHVAWQKIGPQPERDPQKQAGRLKGLKEDLAVTCILGRGNDYLPAVQGTGSPGDTIGKEHSTSTYCPVDWCDYLVEDTLLDHVPFLITLEKSIAFSKKHIALFIPYYIEPFKMQPILVSD